MLNAKFKKLIRLYFNVLEKRVFFMDSPKKKFKNIFFLYKKFLDKISI